MPAFRNISAISSIYTLFAALAQEKQEKAFRDSIEGFHGEQLKHVEVQEKHGSLPDAASKFKLFKLWIKPT